MEDMVAVAEVALEEVVDTEADTVVVSEVATVVDLEEGVDTAAVVALEVVTAILEADTIAVGMITMAPAVMAIVYHLILEAGKYCIEPIILLID